MKETLTGNLRYTSKRTFPFGKEFLVLEVEVKVKDTIGSTHYGSHNGVEPIRYWRFATNRDMSMLHELKFFKKEPQKMG